MEIKISIIGGGLQYEGSTTITKAAQVIAFLNAKENNLIDNNMLPEKSPADYMLTETAPKVSPRQMIIETNSKTNAEKITAFIYYLKKYQNKSSLGVQEIKSLFGKAGETMPQNFSRDLKDAVRLNYVYEINDGNYELTEFGGEAVEKHFVLEDVKKIERKRSKSKISTEVRTEIAKLELGSVEEGFPVFHDLNKGQQILWVCVVVDQKYKIVELSTREIVYLVDHLKGNITTGTFTALNETNIKKGYLKIAGDNFKVTQVGINKIVEIVKEK